MTTKDLRTLERAVALSINFLRALPEDLRVAAIAASADDQPRRSAALDRHAASSRQLAADLGLAWADVAGSPPKASISVDTAVKESGTEITVRGRSPWVGLSLRKVADDVAPMIAEIDAHAKAYVGAVNRGERSANDSPNDELHPDCADAGECQDWYQGPGPGCEGVCKRLVRARAATKSETITTVLDGEPLTFERRELAPQHDIIERRGAVALRLYAGTPESVLSTLFTIADTLGLEGDKDWTLDDIVREVREAASDAAHNDEQGRALVPVAEVCDALGLSPVAREGLAGAEVEIPLDRLMLLTRARGLREALATAMQASVEGARATVRKIEAVEDGLTRRMAERLAVVDREWLEDLMDGAS